MKNIFLSALLLGGLISSAQELTQQDALRYAVEDLNGTARFRGMSGAFGAVGGDLSSLNINPAGSVIFNNNYVSITASNFNTSNKASYFGTKTDECDSTLDLNQIGSVFVFKAGNQENDWRKFSIGLNYENTHDFDNDLYMAGTNPSNSIGDYFLNYAQGEKLTDLQNYYYEDFAFGGQQAFLGYHTFLFDPTSSNTYVSNVPSGSYYQRNYISTTGYNGKITGNFATSYKDKIFIGMNLNAHFTDYVRRSSVYESNSNPEITDEGASGTIRSINFNNEIYTYGTGFSLNVGVIGQVTKDFRLGLAYESPTWYRLNDDLVQTLYTTLDTSSGTNPYSEDPYTINIYPTYKLQTPSKWTGSAAYIFGTQGLLSVDVATKNYSNIEYRPKNDVVYQDLNTGISNTLTNALEVRVGGEYKIKKWSLRAGYRYEESPYENTDAMGDLTGYSGGLGYNFGISRLDLSYANAQRKYAQYLISSGMYDTAQIKATQNNISLTYSVNF